MTNTTPQFSTDYNKGFRMSFNNGMTISVQFGSSNYCSRSNCDSYPMSEMKEYIVTSPDAEIAIWDANGNWFISNEEVNGCTLQQAESIPCDAWLLTLPEIDYNPIIIH